MREMRQSLSGITPVTYIRNAYRRLGEWLGDHTLEVSQDAANRGVRIDTWFATAAVLLLCIGLVMVASASYGGDLMASSWGYFFRQLIAAGIGFVALVVVLTVPIRHYSAARTLILIASFILLLLVLIPGVATEVNGAYRWINLGPVNLQVSEFARLGLIIWMAAYIGKHLVKLQTRMRGMLGPIVVISLAATLLMAQPDYGTAVVLAATLFTMAFLMRAQLFTIALLSVFAIVIAVMGAQAAQYRIDRLLSFADPFADPFGDGYQLSNALIAIGTGGLTGRGLGESVQKMAYLPEAHTDFIFAIFAEETGLIGVIAMVALYSILVWRGFVIARMAWLAGLYTGAALAWGISVWLGMQTLINLGVNMGLLPTKGLTLPLISYGGSSMLASLIALGLILRVHHEASYTLENPPKTKIVIGPKLDGERGHE
ncbi:MAG TPA: putative lipid II flippase FtsW [Halothiobacillaceae bacterium]|nr:putative lipid II flippase FtsW [Halothiobacillaceae bacterium]